MDHINDDNGILESLYFDYLENHGPTDKTVRQYEKELSALLEPFPFRQQDEIWCAVNRLCARQEQLAFCSGLRTGAQLLAALLGLE